LSLDAQLKVTDQTIANRESSVETIIALKDAGQVTQVAVDQNVALYNNAKALKVDLETAICKTENMLNLLLGKPASTIARGRLNDQQMEAEMKLGVPTALLTNRPDVMAAEYGLTNAFEMTNVARSNFYPAFTVTPTGGFQRSELDTLLDANALFAT